MSRVSIIIPYYNSEAFFAETLDSIAHQTHTDIEVVIIDDASQPKSAEKLNQLLSNWNFSGKIQLLTNVQNLMIAESRNKAIAAATGEYVLLLDADDLLAGKYSIDWRVEFLQNNPQFSGVGGYSLFINEQSQVVRKESTDDQQSYFINSANNSEQLLQNYCLYSLKYSSTFIKSLFMLSGGALLKKQVFIENKFDSAFDKEEDIEWTLRYFSAGNLFSLQKLGFHFRRQHAQQHHASVSPEVSNLVKARMQEILSSNKIS